MSAGRRTFGALLAHDGVCLVEYRAERMGVRVVEHWTDAARSPSLDDALGRLVRLISARGARAPRLAVAIEQFGVFHHVKTLPDAPDEILEPIMRREVQRAFGVADPVVVFTRGKQHERRDTAREDAGALPRQMFIAGGPRDTIELLRRRLSMQDIHVETVTAVPKAIHSLYEATGAALEPTAVLVCLEGGPHLAFFLDGRLELAVEPPIALEGERPSVSMVIDQVERGAVYFRQQFRGAVATRMLLAARPDEYDALAAALEERLAVRVKPLFAGASSPDAVVAMGAVLESMHAAPLDLYPHPPTIATRARAAVKGPNAIVAAAMTAAAIAGIWTAGQFATLAGVRRDAAKLRTSIASSAPAVASMRQAAERRADFVKQTSFVADVRDERATLTDLLRTMAQRVPATIRFDSLSVARTATGWSTGLGGEAVGGTSAQAVRSLATFFQSVRDMRGIVDPTLDRFDYPVASMNADSAQRVNAGVVQFHLSFGVSANARDGR